MNKETVLKKLDYLRKNLNWQIHCLKFNWRHNWNLRALYMHYIVYKLPYCVVKHLPIVRQIRKRFNYLVNYKIRATQMTIE